MAVKPCMEWIPVEKKKLIFHWKAHFVILTKLLFKPFVALIILCTVENNEVSSTNSFGLHWRPSDTSLIKMKNKRGPRIGPCGTPARTSVKTC